MNRNKSCDVDNNVTDFFIKCKDFISSYLCCIFNTIYDSGIYPDAWTKGVIVPLFKKGDKNKPECYRGITLVNITAKMFSLVLRNRLNEWCESNNVFSDCQFGFRDGHSTTDAVFILHSIIQKVLAHKKKLWCIFIDYKRAFDTVERDALWHKLIQSGISCKMTKMIKSMYAEVQACVKLTNSSNLSDFFNVTIGLKQGEPLSPLLFLLVINDIMENIDFNALTDSDIQLLSKYLILFADDIVLFTTDPVSLQAQIDCIYDYSCKWSLEINIDKTKICVFEKRRSPKDQLFHINGKLIEIVDSFTYLGIVFNYTGTFNLAIKALQGQALRAYGNLLKIFDKNPLDIKTKISLFDAMVVPILLYGEEVWGVYTFKDIDNLHLRFLRYLLGVKKQTPNNAVYGEFGRLPLSVICKQRSLKFWCKIMSNINSPLYDSYWDQCNTINTNCWAKKINSIIDHLGLTHIRLNFDRNCNYFTIFKRRIYDQFIQSWHMSINNSPKLELYSKFKKEFSYESYLDIISNNKWLKVFARFRLSSHKLEIESGRFNGIPREQRHCKVCSSNLIENEYHFLLCCPQYSVIRQKHLGNMQWPNISKFIKLLSSSKQKVLINLCRYISECYAIRDDVRKLVP